MDEFVKPIEQLGDLFTGAAKAVIATQEKLDAETPSHGPSEDPLKAHPSYSIPRTEVDFKFGLDVRSGVKIMVPFFRNKQGRTERHGHRLKFSLVAVSELPGSLRIDANGSDGMPIRTSLTQPHFLVPAAEQDDLCRDLAVAMKAGRWDFILPLEGEKPSQDRVSKEADRILEALTPDDPERGMVVFKLDASLSSYLIVRVTDKSKKDGLFVFNPESSPEALIYSFEKDDVKNIRYRALHEFALTIRHWLKGAPPTRRPFSLDDEIRPPGGPAPLGLIALKEFTLRMAEGYVAGLKLLSEQDTDANRKKLFPPYYDLTDVEAELRYSVFYDEDDKRMRFSFGRLKRPDGEDVEDEISVIESRASIRAFRSDGSAQVHIELIMPEFALSAGAREIVIDAAVKSADEIALAFNRDDPASYLQFIKSIEHQRGAVIFLSYEGKVPKQEFLIIWPALHLNKPRDFVFTCKLVGDKLDEDSISPVMRLEQDLEPAGAEIGVEIDRDQYEPFHNTFHAARIWRSRVGA